MSIPLLARLGTGGSGVGWRLEELTCLCLRLGSLEADAEAEFGGARIYEGSTPMKEGVKPALDRRKEDLQCRSGLMGSGVNSAPQLSHTGAKLAGHLNLHRGPLEGHGPGVSLQLRKT